MHRAETAIYLVVSVLLVVAAAFTIVGTATDVIEGGRKRAIVDTGAFLLDRVLLLFIFAELLFALRVVNFGGRLQVEPFLLIGLIAVVRKILVLTAETERGATSASAFLIQIGALSGLTLVLAVAIFLLRWTDPRGRAGGAAPGGVPSPDPTHARRS
jgi:uncharacterized membrane protein (DUF373 family)